MPSNTNEMKHHGCAPSAPKFQKVMLHEKHI